MDDLINLPRRVSRYYTIQVLMYPFIHFKHGVPFSMFKPGYKTSMDHYQDAAILDVFHTSLRSQEEACRTIRAGLLL